MPQTVLTLPLRTRLPQILALIGKIAGEPFVVEGFEDAPDVRFTGTQGPLPSLRVIADADNPQGRALISFRAADGQRRNWSFVPELDNEAGKQLSMDSTPLSVAVGRRLCALFGGTLNPGAKGAALEQVSTEQALWPEASVSQPGLWRLLQFNTLLLNTPLITSQELSLAAAYAAEPTADSALRDVIEAAPRTRRGPGL